MTDFPYQLADPEEPALGLIVLQVDETIEQDFRQLFPDNTARLHITRVASGETLTLDTIADMEAKLQASASLLPPAVHFDVIGYACTSGTAAIGAERVATLVRNGRQANAVTDPLTAALAAIKALEISRIGVVSPYIESVAEPIVDAVATSGATVAASLSFGEALEAHVARIDPQSTAEAARAIVGSNRLDGLFLSCTNLRTLDIIDELETELGIPVLSSNQVLAWHMARLAGLARANGPGRLLRE